MNKLLVRSFLVLAAFAALTISAKAQAVDQLVVKIPFQFVAAGQTFPAGEYKISRLRDASPRILILTSLEDRGDNVILRTETAETSQGEAKLGFTTIGNEHVLSRVETGSYAYNFSVPRSEPLLARNKAAAASSASGSN